MAWPAVSNFDWSALQQNNFTFIQQCHLLLYNLSWINRLFQFLTTLKSAKLQPPLVNQMVLSTPSAGLFMRNAIFLFYRINMHAYIHPHTYCTYCNDLDFLCTEVISNITEKRYVSELYLLTTVIILYISQRFSSIPHKLNLTFELP